MSKHSQPRSGPGVLPQVVLMLVGAVLAGAAWFYLVGAAIEFASVARSGQGKAWTFTTAASVGAVVCLVLVLSLGARVLYTLGVIDDYKPRRAAGRRRAR